MAEGERVLIVDGEAAIRKLLLESLRRQGCQVQAAAGGKEAERALNDGLFSVAVLDLDLPDESSEGLLARMRERGLEVIVLSGRPSLESALAALERGVFAYVRKPFDLAKLVNAVRRALAKVGREQERQRLLEGLRGRAEEMVTERQRMLAVLDSLADGVVICGADGAVEFLNTAGQAVLALSADQAVGKTWHALVGLPESECPLSRALTSGQTVRAAEHMIRRNASRRVCIRLSTAVLRNDDGTIAGAAAAFREAGPEKGLEEMRSEFITAAAHQLRTPLTSVRGYVDLLLSGAAGKLDQRQRSYVQAVQRGCQRLEKVVGRVLDLARMEAGALEVEFEPVDIPRVVREAVAAAAAEAEAAGVSLELTADPDSLVMQSDPTRLRQVVEELVGNALHHTPRGGAIRVDTRSWQQGARIVVTDTGVGVPPEARDRLFEVFFRVEGSQVRDQEGAGLGLAIAHSVVSALGGTLEVESALGRGSAFTVTLPQRPSGDDHHGTSR